MTEPPIAISLYEAPATAAFFGTDAMRACFQGSAQMQAWLDVEAALARAQASLGIIPADAGSAITGAARIERFDLAALDAEAKRMAHPLVPLVRALAAAAGDGAGRYVHQGATTQDVMDTGYVLLARNGLSIVDGRMAELSRILRELAIDHRTTPMAGRTHGQQALPTTFGLRAAGWYEEIRRHVERLAQMRPRLLVGSFGGAVGTLAGYGPEALRLRGAVMAELDLGEPGTSWHANQDRFAECLSNFGMIASTGEKLAREVYLLGRTEIGEAFEPQGEDQVGSSTMPQKQNPIRSEAVIAAAQLLRAQVPVALGAMVAQDDRDMGAGMTLWKLIPDAYILLDGILERLVDVLGGLWISPEAMSRNLARTGGLILSEAVMLRLAQHIDRHQAHEAVTEAGRRATQTGSAFIDCLTEHEAIDGRISRADLEALLDPENYIGSAADIVDAAVREQDAP